MELLQLKYFMDAAKYENFSKAAKHNFVPPSSISKAVKILETEFNVCFFDRHGKKIYLNENGRYLYEHAANIFKELDECSNHFSMVKSQNITIYIQEGSFFIPLLVADFMRKFENTAISYSHVTEVLHSNKIPYDFTFMHLIDDMSNYNYTTLLDDDFVLLVSQEHHLSKEEVIDVSSLENEKFVSFYNTIAQRIIIDKICRNIGKFIPEYIFETHDEMAVLHLVSQNEGITLMPEKFYNTHPFPGIKLVKLKETMSSNMVIAWEREKSLSRIETAFRDFCVEWFKQYKSVH